MQVLGGPVGVSSGVLVNIIMQGYFESLCKQSNEMSTEDFHQNP